MGFWSEFKSFAVKGNAFDLAIAVVVGNAFSAIVNSLVGDIITPLAGLLTPAGPDLKTWSLALRPAGYSAAAATTTPALSVNYGSFLQTIINFLIISLSIFAVFKFITVARRRLFEQGEQATPPAQKPDQVRLLEEIRDLLKSRQP